MYPAHTGQLLRALADPARLNRAAAKVRRKNGAAGFDGMPATALADWLRQNGGTLRRQILTGAYRPGPLLRIPLPKPGGGIRVLGIPTVRDRMVQQAILELLTPLFDPGFSPASFAYRPKLGVREAIRFARRCSGSGKGWAGHLDLAKFFDTVDHDLALALTARQVGDPGLLALLRDFLAVPFADFTGRHRWDRLSGLPQGAPVSPLLANVVLNEADRHFSAGGVRFARYADDILLFGCTRVEVETSMREAAACMQDKLRLQVNPEKSWCRPAGEAEFLGFQLGDADGPKPSAKAMEALLTELATMSGSGQAAADVTRRLNQLLFGWRHYFRDVTPAFSWPELDRRIAVVLERAGHPTAGVQRLALICFDPATRPSSKCSIQAETELPEERHRAGMGPLLAVALAASQLPQRWGAWIGGQFEPLRKGRSPLGLAVVDFGFRLFSGLVLDCVPSSHPLHPCMQSTVDACRWPLAGDREPEDAAEPVNPAEEWPSVPPSAATPGEPVAVESAPIPTSFSPASQPGPHEQPSLSGSHFPHQYVNLF